MVHTGASWLWLVVPIRDFHSLFPLPLCPLLPFPSLLPFLLMSHSPISAPSCLTFPSLPFFLSSPSFSLSQFLPPSPHPFFSERKSALHSCFTVCLTCVIGLVTMILLWFTHITHGVSYIVTERFICIWAPVKCFFKNYV